jgi:predicted ATPase/tRNA A-37 threonylcarbamoyl transferase component Bud32
MSLAPGTKLGPYEILGPLGAGGMGEVYRARDSRLDRTVAIKLISQKFLQDSEIRKRLDTEARAISKLSHPNICTLHDIGHQDGTDFLVLEYVEGSTLRHLLAEGNLPVRKIVPIATQIAEGLARAHEAGIIHRDLKPENLIISPDVVKILDFGLAKLSLDGANQTETLAPGSGSTQSGAVVGTFKYMSPEQASGQTLDFRSDQFSFGSVLYEMATGNHPFARPNLPQTLLALLHEEPPAIASLNPEVPQPLSWVVERCLAKQPEKRYSSTRDLVRDLKAIRDRLADLHLAWAPERPCNLPAASTPLIGRKKDLEQVLELVLSREARLITITGPGGIGKTHFAIELVRQLTGRFPSGVYFVSLGSVSDLSVVPAVIAQTLGIRESKGQPPHECVKQHLRESLTGAMLLLIDNFEHLLGAAPLLAELLAQTTELKILVTSRAALHVQGEKEFALPPLALPDKPTLSLSSLQESPAIALFVQRAAAVKPGFTLTSDNASAVTEICSKLDGLPLAIQLAAARIKLLSPAGMRSRLASRLQLLTSGARDVPARQQTLRQTIDWSYDLLTEPEQKMFRRLSVFAAGFTLEAAEAVCDTKQDLGLDVLDGLSSIVDKSLVRQVEQTDGESRFVMLETLCEYGLEKLSASGEEPLTRKAHAAYYLVLAEDAAAEKDAGQTKSWLDLFAREHDNFRAALDWLTSTRHTEWALRLATALFRFWEMREFFTEGRQRLEAVLQLPSTAALDTARMRALFAAGVLASNQEDSDRLFHENLAIARRLHDQQSVAVSLNALAVRARENGKLSQANDLFTESLALWKELGDRLAVARALSNLAAVRKSQGSYNEAHSLYEQCQAIFAELGDRTGIGWTFNHQADLLREQGDLATARMLYECGIGAFREVHDRWGIAGSLTDLGNLIREQGDFATSGELYRESLSLFQDLGHKRGIARALESFAALAAVTADSERALRLAGVAAALRQSIGAPLTLHEQAKVDHFLEPARQKLSIAAQRSAWLEGWAMPLDVAVSEVLKCER